MSLVHSKPDSPENNPGSENPGSNSPPDGDGRNSARKRLAQMFLLTTTFMVVELVGGLYSGSLALLADAGHMLTDSMALGLSYFAIWLSGRETSLKRTYGFRRAEILAAFLNALLLILLAFLIIKEALERLYEPRPVMEGILLLVALAGLGVNVLGYILLHRQARTNINIRSALWHILGDMLGSIGTIIAAVVIYFTGWMAIDPLIGVGIAVLIGVGSGRILYDSTNLLLDSVPRDIDSQAVRDFIHSHPEVAQICDLHIWAVSASEAMLTAHLVVGEGIDRDLFLHELLEELRSRFGLAHLTVQLESNPLDSCNPAW